MPIVGSPVYPGPTVLRLANRTVARFGNAALPNGQGIRPYTDLNDQVNTVLVNQFNTDDNNRQIGLEQLLYRGRGAYTSDDFGPRTLTLPMIYMEDPSHFMGTFLASLSQAGEQQLTFDNATCILAKYKGISGRIPARPSLQAGGIPNAWDFTLELIAKSPWFQDLLATAWGPLPLTVDAGQTFSLTYVGSVWAEPIWTLVVPASNPVAINSFQIRNTMSGEFLTVNFLSVAAIPATTARTLTINCAAMTAVDNLGNSFDLSGSFPMVYPPNGQANPFTVIVTPASGTSSGLTLSASWFARWQI